jgi:quaternary ammonium compound-resistance protein SugE
MSADAPSQSVAWIALLLAGVFEIGFTTAMKLSGSGRLWPDVAFIVCVIASFSLLQYAARAIPLGIAYAVWTGVGAAGTLLVSRLVFKDAINAVQIGLVLALIACVAGIKLAESKPPV